MYRKNINPVINLTPEMVLQDTINTCVIIAKRGRGTHEEKANFKELQSGIKAFGNGFLMSGHFRIDDAISASARIAYLAAKILANDLSPIIFYNGQGINEWNIEDPNWNFLNRFKRYPDKSSFYYWHQAVQLIMSK